jgi:cyclic dehypoxanthinyl futalosine synthase
MGSTMLEENVVSAAGCTFRLGRQELGRLIEAAGFEPALRDQEYRIVGTP